VGRTVFISSWLIVPIAVYGLSELYARKKWWGGVALVVGVATPYIFQSIIQYAPLFIILDQCHNNVPCAWNFFWDNWHKFSRTGIGRPNVLW